MRTEILIDVFEERGNSAVIRELLGGDFLDLSSLNVQTALRAAKLVLSAIREQQISEEIAKGKALQSSHLAWLRVVEVWGLITPASTITIDDQALSRYLRQSQPNLQTQIPSFQSANF